MTGRRLRARHRNTNEGANRVKDGNTLMKQVMISIKGSQTNADTEEDAFELMTDGEYTSENGISTFSYIESQITGYDGLLTTFQVEPDRVVLSRGGGINGDMIFSETQKHHFLYETPFGMITMGIDTHHIHKNMDDEGGSLEIQYVIDVDNMVVSRNLFKIDIKGR